MGIRISGMASGMDTEKMIKDLMKAQREPVNRLQRSKTSIEWKRDAYRDMNTILADLQNTLKDLRLSSSFNKKTATSENDNVTSARVVGKPTLSSYTVEVLNLAKAGSPPSAEFTTGLTDSKGVIGGADFTIAINKDGVEVPISVLGTDTMEGVLNKINNAKSGVKASFFNNKLVLTSEDGKQFEVKASGSNNLNMGTSTPSTAGTAGTPATFKINGVEYTSKTNSVLFDGIDFTFKQANGGNPVVVNTKTDEDAVFNMIKGFVDKYNAVIDTMNKKISEPKYKGYQPLLDEEKEALPEKTAEKMDNMARSGLLLRDPILTGGLNELRRALSTPLQGTGVNKSFDTLSEIGIGGPPSGKYAYEENGKLYINETKLRESIRTNGEDVLKLFTNYSNETIDRNKKYNESGVAERLYDKLKDVMEKVTKEAGSAGRAFDDSNLSKKLTETDREIDRWEDRLKMIEDRYWKQFTAMERAMSKSQSQGAWFAQMLGQK
ncbi:MULTISPECIES: flagellar filament capping protein FliD [Brevibacillus]|uniref:flagellar filament capping protein FliD n=1 Tax=Brevibacillus TaxID=55080 RepID=UPI000D10DFDC|nr:MULTISPECIES: flagellar filament capping protein FliD [Brevibacillus]MED1944683.1 flagellar filament capping protein FliD [Brevibacillus formosus]MED1996630.1 flagellar filament capping protein FliD [Brevibacillus formosus]MED2081599.1 flagellar filament capping protein FliD [Brevibacillus formosus]PSK12385.1 flagellar hook protein [Brevibacillus sp. NRRL NRS-603]